MNQTRFLEFLRKEEVLKSENKSLYEVEKSENSELTSYRIVLQKQIFYQNRSQYIVSMGGLIVIHSNGISLRFTKMI